MKNNEKLPLQQRIERVFETIYKAIEHSKQAAVIEGFTSLPARVAHYDNATKTATIEILSLRKKPENKNTDIEDNGTYEKLYDIYVCRYLGGDKHFFCEVEEHNEGLLHFCNRSIADYSNGVNSMAKLETFRFNNIADCFFTPNLRNPNSFPGHDRDHELTGCGLATNDGTKKVQLNDDAITASFGTNTLVLDDTSLDATIGSSTMQMSNTTITLTAGGTTLTIDSSGVTIDGADVIHAGLGIGSAHIHGGGTIEGKTSGVME